jgi:hypothetical protein
VFNEVAELYDRIRPGYPDELFAGLVTITGMDERSSVLEVGCGTGQATRSLAALGCSSAWHWVDPSIGGQRARDVLYPGGWMALLGNVVVRRPGEPEMYAETADLHERFSPGNPDWGDAIAERIRTRMGDRVSRRYLSVLRIGQRAQ